MFEDSIVEEGIESYLSGGDIVAAQLPSPSDWSPEKKLAGAVLRSGIEAADLEWMESDDIEYAFSFLRLCDLFDFDPDWVRERVRRLLATTNRTRPSDFQSLISDFQF